MRYEKWIERRRHWKFLVTNDLVGTYVIIESIGRFGFELEIRRDPEHSTQFLRHLNASLVIIWKARNLWERDRTNVEFSRDSGVE